MEHCFGPLDLSANIKFRSIRNFAERKTPSDFNPGAVGGRGGGGRWETIFTPSASTPFAALPLTRSDSGKQNKENR
ncbi:hypothetical protein NQZ68_021947 [Dissostichus eleginoides]|nr:hypothetical protein NQZ68_021947 [Dissostichus eleginoides]